MLPCLVIGHTLTSPGARNAASEVTEFAFNDSLAEMIARELSCRGVEIDVVYRDEPNDYSGLPYKVNALNPSFIIELHCNAAAVQASGTEMLYWYSSKKGKAIANALQNAVVGALGLRDRGLKPIQSHRERGGYLLMKTQAPCVIAESFFIDSDHDLGRAVSCMNELVSAYADTIERFA